MVDYYIAGGSTYDNSEYGVYAYCDHGGYDESEYGNRPIQVYGDEFDPFWSLGINTETMASGQQQAEFGLLDSWRIKVTASGIFGYHTASGWIAMVGAGAGVHYHDGDTLQLDGIDSDGVGAFDFKTNGVLNLKPSGATTSFGEISMYSGILCIKSIGSESIGIQSDHADYVGLYNGMADFSNYLWTGWHKTGNQGVIQTKGGGLLIQPIGGTLQIQTNNDAVNYREFYTDSGYLYTKIYGGGGEILIVSDHTDYVYTEWYHDGSNRAFVGYDKTNSKAFFSSSSTIKIAPSNDEVNCIEISTDGSDYTHITAISPSLARDIIFDSDNTTWAGIYNGWEDMSNYIWSGWNKVDNYGLIQVYGGPLKIQTNSDIGNYFEFSVTSNVPKIDFVGGVKGKITNLEDGSASSDAMAFGQKYTDANAVSAVATANMTITGSWVFNTDTATNPLYIGRSGSKVEQCMSIGVTDRNVAFTYIEDEESFAGSITFICKRDDGIGGYTDENSVILINSTDGSASFPQNIAMVAGKTVDGVDISAHDGGDVETYHSNYYTNADAVSAVATADDYLKNDASDTMDAGTNTTFNIVSDDDGESVIRLYGSSQGTGRLFVGQSLSHGGGIEYNGDNDPVYSGAGSDMITLYRVSSSIPYWTARNLHSSNDWEFRGNITTGGTVDGVTVADHSARHINGGADEISVAGLSGELADAQTPKTHAMDSATYHTSSDVTTLNASTTKHGFLKKLDNDSAHFMNGQGNWAVASSAGIEGVASNDLVFQNDTEQYSVGNDNTYVQLKEIIVYRSMKLRIYWQHKRSDLPAVVSMSRIYINGTPIGSEHGTPPIDYVAYTEDITVNVGDTVELWGYAFQSPSSNATIWVRYMRIQSIEYVSNDP